MFLTLIYVVAISAYCVVWLKILDVQSIHNSVVAKNLSSPISIPNGCPEAGVSFSN
ncbi:MAG: hypothetical protein F6K06_28455 [Okeania sp. SIO1H4]|uniref:hypothetical protein n=1 Tax=Okeania sp. SIO1F9 TaxID=2607813 RepID=UPI0013CCDB35|nr:hypothetical protein [Okeania sp. SIO1H4]NES89912.1 hypothetical protein [Okeania sp. SIO2B9]